MDTTTGKPFGQEHEPDELNETLRTPVQTESDEALGAPSSNLEPAKSLRLDNDRDLSRVGAWSLGLSALGTLIGVAFMLAGGILPGALVVAVSLVCAFIGALSLSLVAHHQG